MTPQELKASILQLAIQGKLVEHFESEEAIVIHASFAGDTSDFFEIPDNWKWLSIKDVASVNTGLSFKKQDQRDSSNGSLRVLRGGNIGDDYKYHLYEDDVYVELEQFQTKYIQLLEGDIITPSVTSIEKICKTGYIDRELPKVTAGGFVYIIRCLDSSIIDPKYLMYFIASAFNKEQCKPNIHKSGQAFYNLKKSGFIEQPICVPPLAEQQRIVAKIEELLPLIDRYEQAWSRLEDFNKRFPVDMQKSILQMAIQGKLVPQLPEEGTASVLKKELQKKKAEWVASGRILKKADSKPFLDSDDLFDIPDSWEWVQLSDVSIIQEGAGIRKWQYRDAGTQILCVTNILEGDIDLEKKKLYISTDEYLEKYRHLTLNKGDIVTSCSGGSWGKIAFFDCEDTMMLNTSTLRMRFFDDLADNNYLYYVCKSPFFKRQLELQLSGMQPNFGYAHYSRILLPLPPLAEQKRIVAKLEEILPLCERLK